MDGWDWLWMTFIMGLWLVVIGVVVYVAVRLARRPPRAGHP
jgi:heme/copper-type cytochrome/quinol oxidase subunit 2